MASAAPSPGHADSHKGLSIDISRLSRDIYELSQIGRNPDTQGIYRMGFSRADMEGRRWLMDRISEAGLTPRMDGAGNVFGHWEYPSSRPCVLSGSHLDTVPAGGPLDGALGVLAALECQRVIKEAKIPLTYPVDLVAFSDEEGRFGAMFGVEALCGLQTPATIQSLKDIDGLLLVDAMREVGLEPLAALDSQRLSNVTRAYLELHIEQGPVLESSRVPIGVVSGITGLFKWKARLTGKSNHSGTTPMNLRRDAFMGLAEFANELGRILEENGSELARGTIGKVDVFPGHAHIVPGAAEFSLVVRDGESVLLNALSDAMRKTLSAIARRRGLMFDFTLLSSTDPCQCHPKLQAVIAERAEALGLEHVVLPSGAGHDAQFMTRIAPSGMIFVPSREGTSHSPQEWTDLADIEKGANLLLHSILALATSEQSLAE